MDFTLTAAQRELTERATKAGNEFRDQVASWDDSDDAPYRGLFDRMGEMGLCALTMPVEYGGQGLTAVEYALVVEAVIRSSQSWLPAEPTFCTSGPGPAMLLLGGDDVKAKYLPALVAGTRGCNIALTEPGHGSALTHLETSAVDDGDSFIVTGSKSFVTGAVVNDLHAVFVRFNDIAGAKGIGALIVEDSYEGVRPERGPHFVGDRGIPHGNLHLDHVRVPKENLIVGAGHFSRLMRAFNMERLHNCALWLGLSEAAYDEAVNYVEHRVAFGKDLIEFQSIYHSIADMWTDIEALRYLVHHAAATAEDGLFPDLQAVTIAKLFGATHGPLITLKSLELHGGYGATMDYPIQRIHRDAISSIVAGGAPGLLRNGIASGLFPQRRFTQT